MVRYLHLLILILYSCGFSNKEATEFQIEQQSRNPWSGKFKSRSSTSFHFAIVSDRTAIPAPGVFQSALEKINYLQPDFVMSVGDLVQGFTHEGRITDLIQIDQEWNYVINLIEKLDMPFFYTPGNNDINSSAALPLWEKRFGKTYYEFIYRNTLFLVINTDDPPGSRYGAISQMQLEWFKSTIQRHSEVSWTFIFMHRPIWAVDSLKNEWEALQNAISINKNMTLFAGHTTQYDRTVIDGIECYTLAKTGSFSPGSPPPADDFDHIMWVTMSEGGPVVANLLLNGIWGEDPVKEAQKD